MITLRSVFVLFFLLSFSLPAFSARVTGVIDGIYSGSTIKGWACVTTRTSSIPIHIYVGGQAGTGTYLAADMASDFSETAVDNACQHSGTRGRHRFSYTFTEAQKRAHQGKTIYVHGIGSGVPNYSIGRSGTFRMPAPATPVIQGRGRVESFVDGHISGWACHTGSTNSVYVDLYAGSQRIRSILASQRSKTTTDANNLARYCEHVGRTGNHRFSMTLSNAEKTRYVGQRLTVKVRSFATVLPSSTTLTMPGDVDYHFQVSNAANIKGLNSVSLEWNVAHTNSCGIIRATVVSFAGRAGVGHGEAVQNEKRVEAVLGQNCVRFVRVNVNPGSNSSTGGYWLRNNNYRSAANLMTDIIRLGSSSWWRDAEGERPFQNKIIVAGSSAGGMVAASALEWSSSYRSLVDRTLMISGPVGADMSDQCKKFKNAGIKNWLDQIWGTAPTCANCSEGRECNISSSKDVVNIDDNRLRTYIQNDPNATDTHEIAILVGANDPIGCERNSLSNDCGSWTAVGAVEDYVEAISGGRDAYTFFQNGGISSRFRPNTINVIRYGTHDLWNSSATRRLVCQNVLDEVGGVAMSSCNSL